ncbi:hypothetical protein ACWDSJ_21030 [Nocardia sp. NPDC003482]
MAGAISYLVAAVAAAAAVATAPVSTPHTNAAQYWHDGHLTWVSVSYLREHPEVLPDRLTVVDGRPQLVGAPNVVREVKGALKCDANTCIHVWGDSIFVDKSALYYYSPPTGCLDNHWNWFPAGGGGPRGMYHTACPKPNDAGKIEGFYYDDQGPTGAMQDRTQLCGSWIGRPGVACADIER